MRRGGKIIGRKISVCACVCGCVSQRHRFSVVVCPHVCIWSGTPADHRHTVSGFLWSTKASQTPSQCLRLWIGRSSSAGVLVWQAPTMAYMSCQLKPNEVQWAQIEKEALAICAACHKWDLWLYGKAIIVYSNHQALETIFNKPLAKAPKRLPHIMFRLQRYSIQVVYFKGSSLVLADTLSRAPLNIANDASPTNFDLFRVSVERQNLQPNIHLTSATAKAMQLATKTDPSMQQLVQMSQLDGLHRKHPFQSAWHPSGPCMTNYLSSTALYTAVCKLLFHQPCVHPCWRRSMHLTWVRIATIACVETSCIGPGWSRPFRTSAHRVDSVLSMVPSMPENRCRLSLCLFRNILGSSSARTFFTGSSSARTFFTGSRVHIC